MDSDKTKCLVDAGMAEPCPGAVSAAGECVFAEDNELSGRNMYAEDYNLAHLVMVNFHTAGKYQFTQAYGYDTSVAQLKFDLANRLHASSPDQLQIMHWHVFLSDCTTLQYIATECRGFLDLTVVNVSSDRDEVSATEDMVVPDIITVRVDAGDGHCREITVEIEDRRIRKPYIGGYRHRDTGIQYHHAYTQTGPAPPRVRPRDKNARDTQTVDVRHRPVDMPYSRATQMSTEHTWIPTTNDRILTAKEYETAAARATRIGCERHARTIQRYYRRWKLNRALKQCVAEYRARIQNEKREQAALLADYELQRKREIVNKVFPRTRADFGMLYAMVDRWKRAHIARISKLYTPARKLAEFYMLLNKEIEMLGVIERHRQRLKQEMQMVREMRFFDEISEPIRWRGYRGLQVSMDTLETQKGKEFKELYYAYCNHSGTPLEDRVQLLAGLSFKLKQHNCTLGNELASLLDRELELLHLGMDSAQLDMLRKRTQLLLLKHFKTPECNEGVTRRMDKVRTQAMANDLIFCPRCQTFKSHKDYPLNHGSSRFRTCVTCTWLDRTAEPWIDIAPYRLILRTIRRDEKQRNSASSVAFIVQERDIHYLVERVWHAQSVVSECKVLEQLRLVRWDVAQEWSPWNCILLTEAEAHSHLRVTDLRAVYDEEFFKIIIGKHMFARCVFANVLQLECSIRQQAEKDDAEAAASKDKGPIVPYKACSATGVAGTTEL